MRTIQTLFLFLICCVAVQGQELNCAVVINAEQTGQDNLQVFKTLQRAVTEFMNETVWTKRNFKQQERIDCSINIIVSSIDVDNFDASIQVQSSRPVYGSSYTLLSSSCRYASAPNN